MSLNEKWEQLVKMQRDEHQAMWSFSRGTFEIQRVSQF